MTAGLAVTAAGTLLLAEIGPDAAYLTDVLPGLLLLGLGQAIFVAPLTGAVFAAVPAARAGIASGVNNAIARTGQLLAIAVVPGMVGIARTPLTDSAAFGSGYRVAGWICAGLFLIGAALSAALMPRPGPHRRSRPITATIAEAMPTPVAIPRKAPEYPAGPTNRPRVTAPRPGPPS